MIYNIEGIFLQAVQSSECKDLLIAACIVYSKMRNIKR